MSDDLIKRSDAIKAIRKLPNAGIRWTISAELAFDALLNVPSADRPQGEWIFVESKISDRKLKKCSVCGLGYVSLKPDNYCPHCGAQMKGADDGRNAD